MAKDKDNPLLGLNGTVTDEHLAEVETAIAERERELAGLRQLHKLGLALLGKTPARKAPTRKSAADGGGRRAEPVDLDTKRRQVVKFLAQGVKSGREIIVECGVAPVKLAETMDCPWFSKTAQGYHLTTLARQQAL